MSSTPPSPSSGGPEYLGPTSSPAAGGRPGGRRWGLLAGVAVGAAGVVAAGAWGAYGLLAGGGDQPAEALPADTVGYLSLDLDPDADQKVEAFRILRSFPALERELDISDREDLRRWVFEQVQQDGLCEGLDYAEDIEPWIGDRAAVAAVPHGADSVAPVVALQVTDAERAEAGIRALAECGESGTDLGVAVVGDYAVVAEGQARANSLADRAQEASLADDEGFNRWTDEVGQPGVVTMYASAKAPTYLSSLEQQLMPPAYASSTGMPAAPATSPVEELYENFEGMAATVRFEDGAFEVAFATAGMPGALDDAAASGAGVSSLPASTGAALSFSLPDGWLETYLDQMATAFGGGVSAEDMLAEMEALTGLSLPEDLETLLGDGVAVALDAEVDLAALESADDPSQVPAGIKVQGDPEDILRVVEKLKARIGPDAEMLVVDSDDEAVAFGFDPAYVERLLDEGGLGDSESFRGVVPEADQASGVFFLDFDAGDGWAEELADLVSDGDPEARENVAPLDAMGISSWTDGDVQHGLFRLTTD